MQNIISAWQKGGTFEGRPVTDDMVLAFWRERMSNVSKDDPLYDTYKNTYGQYDYAISESKAATAYAQGKLSDAGMAQFYLGWAKKVPRDSEFWRQLQQDAARFMQASAARSRAGAASARDSAYGSYTTEIGKKYIQLGDTLTSLLTQIARDNNLIGQQEDLTDFMLAGQNDPGRMENLLGRLTDAMRSDPVGFAPYIDAIKESDPGFDGNLTSSYFAMALDSQVKGYGLIRDRALADGKSDKARAAAKAMTAALTLGAEARSWPVAATYSKYRDVFDATWNNKVATSEDKRLAAEQFASEIERLAERPGLDLAMANRIRNDAAALRGDNRAANQPSFYESYLGTKKLTLGQDLVGGTTGATGEDAKFRDEIKEITYWKQQYDAYPGSFIYASMKRDALGQPAFDETGKGAVGIVPVQSVAESATQASIVPVATLSGGAIMQAVPVTDVVVDDPYTGKTTVVGKSMTYTTGGVQRTIYGFDRNGERVWTTVAPWAPSVSEVRQSDGIHLQVPRSTYSPSEVAAAFDKVSGMRVADAFKNGQTPAEGQTWSSARTTAVKGQASTAYQVTWKNGQLIATRTEYDTLGRSTKTTEPLVALTPFASPGQPPVDLSTAVLDKSRLAAGANPTIEFALPAMAAIAEAQGSAQAVVAMWNSPAFQAQLEREETVKAGGDRAKLMNLTMQNREIVQNLVRFGATSGEAPWARERIAQERIAQIGPSKAMERIVPSEFLGPNGQRLAAGAAIRFGQPLVVPAVTGISALLPAVGAGLSGALEQFLKAAPKPITPPAPPQAGIPVAQAPTAIPVAPVTTIAPAPLPTLQGTIAAAAVPAPNPKPRTVPRQGRFVPL